MEPIISIKDLSVVFGLGKSNETPALKNINLEIFEGEYVIFFGPSGSGKSTLLYTIAGLEPPVQGEVKVKSKNVFTASEKEKMEFHRTTIGMIFQAYFLIPQLSARDNILLPQLFLGESESARKERANRLIERFDITSFADRKPSRMSGGQQQRTAIARSLINNPAILLADEPVGNLDSKNAEIVLDLLYKINQEEKKTVIYVTHNPRDLHYAHRVFYLKDGQIERVVTNPKRENPSNPDQAGHTCSDLERIATIYPYLDEQGLQAKLLTRQLLSPYDFLTEEKIEEIITKYIKGMITRDVLTSLLDDPKRGAGLNSQRARHFAEEIERLVGEVTLAEGAKKKELGAVDKAVVYLRDRLLDSYGGELSLLQLERLNALLRKRMEQTIDHFTFRRELDQPMNTGGVGLNRKTARRFAEELALALMDDNAR